MMSASYIHRDPSVLNQNTQVFSRLGATLGHNEYLSDTALCQNQRSFENRSMPTKSSPTSLTQVSLQSPKMSPDSTLTHPHPQTPNSVPRFPSPSAGFCATGATVSPLCDGFLRSALNTDISDRPCLVGSSTGIRDISGATLIGASQMKSDHSRSSSAQVTSLVRPRAMTASNPSRACTPNNAPSSSTSIPSSTTPVKKSSRRNPWGPETYSDLISIAIHSYPDHQATLQQIYDFIITHYEYFRERSDPAASAGWKNSIRHNLSLHDRFTKCPKSSDNTKSSYWRINTEVASKPYVRRRACSMDNTNSLKRPAGSMKTNNRNVGGASRGTRPSVDKLNNRSLNPLNGCDSVQCAPNLTIGLSDTSPRIDLRSQQSSKQFSRPGYGLASKLPSYFQPANTLGKDQELHVPCNGNRWTNFKLSPPGSTLHYPYDQLSSNILESEFNSISGSTDHELVRNRASSLIENLLRSDHIGMEIGNSTIPHLPQTYVPNAPMNHPSLSVHWGVSANHRSGMMDHAGSSLLSATCQPHPLDMTPQSTQGRSLSPETAVDNLVHHNHLRPVRLHSTTASNVNNSNGHAPESVESMFGSPWQTYASQFQFPMANSVSNMYQNLSGITSFSGVSGRQTDGFKPNYDASLEQHSVSSPSTSANSMLPFFSSTSTNAVCTASHSPSASSSTSSSTRSWRHVLGLDGAMHGEHSNIPDRAICGSTVSGSSGLETRPVTSLSPVSHCYSPLRHGLLGSFASPDCALDTPPYHQIKQESLESAETGPELGVRNPSSAASKPAIHTNNYGALSAAAQLSSGIPNRCYSVDYTYEDDEDHDKLELELSLELADRIVRSTKSDNK